MPPFAFAAVFLRDFTPRRFQPFFFAAVSLLRLCRRCRQPPLRWFDAFHFRILPPPRIRWLCERSPIISPIVTLLQRLMTLIFADKPPFADSFPFSRHWLATGCRRILIRCSVTPAAIFRRRLRLFIAARRLHLRIAADAPLTVVLIFRRCLRLLMPPMLFRCLRH